MRKIQVRTHHGLVHSLGRDADAPEIPRCSALREIEYFLPQLILHPREDVHLSIMVTWHRTVGGANNGRAALARDDDSAPRPIRLLRVDGFGAVDHSSGSLFCPWATAVGASVGATTVRGGETS
jgi:hypothetical protein